MKNKTHTVIFDLDGTLSDSAILTMAALKTAAPRFRLPMPAAEAIQRATGHSNPQFYYILFPEAPREIVFEMGQMVEQEELRLLPTVKDSLLFEGCRELLTCLKERELSLNIASTGDNNHVFSILKETGIIGLFDKISCGRPDKIEILREMTGNDKSGFIMVGDMKKDSDGARANGVISVGACYGYCLRELAGFDYYIDTPMELLNFLNIL